MGLFDEVRVDLELKKHPKGSKFQTKSFGDPCLNNYVITEKGEIYVEHWDREWVHDESRPGMFKGYMRTIEGSYRREYLTDFHGDIRLYDETDYEYICRFSYGKLDRITFKTRERLNDNDSPVYERTTVWE